MKKLSHLLVCLIIALCATGCKLPNKNQTDTRSSAATVEKEVLTPCTILTDSVLPQHVDLKYDIAPLSYQELRLLRSYVYATKGYWFIEGDLNKFFTSKAQWYYPLCDSLAYAEQLPKTLADVPLSPEEKAFVRKIDLRMLDMEGDKLLTTPRGLRLNNPDLCANLFQLSEPDEQLMGMLRENNMAIARTPYEQLFNVYEANDYQCMPSFITPDLYLQALHMYFGYLLKSLEGGQFIPALSHTIEALHRESFQMAEQATDMEVKDAAEYNATFFAIAGKLLTDTTFTVPEAYREDYIAETKKAMACGDEFSSYLGYTDVYFPYSLFRPRGHYTRKESSQRYFRAMMWLQTASFCRQDSVALRKAALMATAFNRIPKEVQKECRGVYNTLSFLMGQPDNLSILEMADKLKSMGITDIRRTVNPNVLADLDTWLIDRFKTRNRIAPKIQISCADKINFMPQRYMPDSEVLGTMTDVTPDSERAFPKGLDIMAAMGSDYATTLLDSVYREHEAWAEYGKNAQRMRNLLTDTIDWSGTMYNKWMQLLSTLQQTDKQTPDLLRTDAWQRKSLNTALASWTELKHDAILYAEQPMAAECGGGGELPDPIVVGYVEPNLPFWTQLKDLLVYTNKLLADNGLLTVDLQERAATLEEKVDFCIEVVRKELRGETLTEEEYMDIAKMGSSMEWFTLSVIDPDLKFLMWDDLQGPDRNIAIVADVYTRNVDGCTKNGVLHEATGLANEIYVPVRIGRNIFITRGATFSYYEFVRPLGERLTDEEWQQMLRDNQAPAIPLWMQPLMLGKEPEVNEVIFYHTGC